VTPKCPSSCDGDRDMPGLRGSRRCDYRSPIRNVNVLLRDLRRLGWRSLVDKTYSLPRGKPKAAALRFFRMLTDELRTNIINYRLVRRGFAFHCEQGIL
jgi:hypothetical protein